MDILNLCQLIELDAEEHIAYWGINCSVLRELGLFLPI